MDRIGAAMGESGMTPLLPYTPIGNRPYRSDDETTTDGRGGMPTFASLFSGFGGADIGAIAAGLKPIWAIEYEADIVAVYRQNLGGHIAVADILDCDPADFEQVDFLHASPPCPNFSNAKAGAEETPHDIALAEKVAEFVTVLLPEKFTLENVYKYRESQSWGIIAQTLLLHGYQFNYWHCNMADYGVPQSRRRMIVIARRDGIKPMLPPATHAEKPEVGLFGTLKPWVGWYDAVSDIFDKKKSYQPTKRLLGHIANSGKTIGELVILDGQNTSFDSEPLTIKAPYEPVFTVNANRSPTEYLIKNGQYYASPIEFALRWQTFPDDYEGAFFYGIGNAVPPLFMRRLYEALT